MRKYSRDCTWTLHGGRSINACVVEHVRPIGARNPWKPDQIPAKSQLLLGQVLGPDQNLAGT